MRILAIETSCDETAIALLDAKGCLPAGRQGLTSPRFKIIKSVVSSQAKIHAHWGGVVPNLAKREHIKNLPIIFKNLRLKTYDLKPDLIAVTVGPGLEPALWTGVNFSKEIHKELTTKNHKLKTKLVGVNHLEGHLYSFLLAKNYKLKTKGLFPAIALIVSGGHTILLRMNSFTKRKKLGETRDDAVGEAFDKVARMLRLPYPGGPEIERLAQKGNPDAIKFPRPMINDKNYEFSFSGLKTSVLYYLRDNPEAKKENVAASFQAAAIETLVTKTIRAAREFDAKSIMLSGGVASNAALRHELKIKCQKLNVNFFVPPKKFNTDNAVMIAVAAYINYLRKKNLPIRARGSLNL